MSIFCKAYPHKGRRSAARWTVQQPIKKHIYTTIHIFSLMENVECSVDRLHYSMVLAVVGSLSVPKELPSIHHWQIPVSQADLWLMDTLKHEWNKRQWNQFLNITQTISNPKNPKLIRPWPNNQLQFCDHRSPVKIMMTEWHSLKWWRTDDGLTGWRMMIDGPITFNHVAYYFL